MPQAPILMMNTSTAHVWRRVAKSFSQHTVPAPLQCLLETSDKAPAFSDCRFLPSHTSADTGLNRNLEVCICETPWSWPAATAASFRKKDVIRVQLLRRNVSLLSFDVSLRKRQANGYGLALSRRTSTFDPWAARPDAERVFLVASAIRGLEPTRPDVSIHMLLEFVAHNVLLGFHHQFLGVFLDARGAEFQRTVAALSPFINAGLVTLTSFAVRGVDDVSGSLGLVFLDDYTRFVHFNQVLSLSRGMATHLVLLGASEFLALDAKRFPTIDKLLASLPPLTYPKVYFKLYTFGVADPAGSSGKGPRGPGESVATYYRFAQPFGPLPAFNVAIIPVPWAEKSGCWLCAWHEAAVCGSSETEIARPVRPEDALFVNQEDAQVYFFRQANFDPWQLKRQHYLPESNNYTRHYAQAVHIYLRNLPEAQRLPGPLSPGPRGQQWLRNNGFVECRPSEGCARFGDIFHLKR